MAQRALYLGTATEQGLSRREVERPLDVSVAIYDGLLFLPCMMRMLTYGVFS